MSKVGKVYLVGAGPGDPDLLTIRAVQRISIGDVIVYDRLIQQGVLALAKPSVGEDLHGQASGAPLAPGRDPRAAGREGAAKARP